MIEVTDEMERAMYGPLAAAGPGRHHAAVRAGLAAVLAIVERDYVNVDGVHQYGQMCPPGRRCVYCHTADRLPSRVQARDEPCADPANCDVHR